MHLQRGAHQRDTSRAFMKSELPATAVPDDASRRAQASARSSGALERMQMDNELATLGCPKPERTGP